MKRSAFGISMVAVALVGLGAAACAGIVGADFGDVHALADAGLTDLDAPTITPLPDSSTVIQPPDSSIPVNEAGACPNGLTACSVGCVDLSSSPSHCHDCATACPSDPHGTAVCVASGCSFSCGTGYELCSSGSGCCIIPVVEAGTPDTGPPPTATIPCAQTPCATLNGGFCCGANNDNEGDVCGNAANADTLGCDYQFFCGSSAQCGAGTVCCFDDDEQTPSSVCQASCSHGETQFCDPTKTSECQTGTCSASNTYTGDNNELQTTYYFCQ